MIQVGIRGEIKPEPSGNPSDSALRISLLLRLYITAYPSSRHNTDTVLQGKPCHIYYRTPHSCGDHQSSSCCTPAPDPADRVGNIYNWVKRKKLNFKFGAPYGCLVG